MGADGRLLDGRKNAGRSEILGSFASPAEPPTTFPPPVTVIDCRAEDPEGAMVTIYLDATQESGAIEPEIIVPPDPGHVAYQPYVVAEVEWGTDGYQSQCEVDFVRGSALSLTASYVRVKARIDERAFLGSIAAAFSPVRCAAFMCYGTRPSSHQGPTRTLFWIVDGGEAGGVFSEPLEIPRYARSLSLMVPATTFPVPAHRVEIYDSNMGLLTLGNMQGINASQDATHVELPLNARLVRVFNAVPGELRMIVVCHLAL